MLQQESPRHTAGFFLALNFMDKLAFHYLHQNGARI